MKAQDALSGRFGAVWNKALFTTSRNRLARTGHVCAVARKVLNSLCQKCSKFLLLVRRCSKYSHSKPTVKFGDCNILQCYATAMLLSVDSCQPNVSKDATPQCPKMSKGRLLSRDPQVPSFISQTLLLSHLAEAPKWPVPGPVPVTLDLWMFKPYRNKISTVKAQFKCTLW